jgi:hypothetical protein
MKFTERSNGLYLENIKSSEIRFSNLAGRLTGSVYEDPNKPKHVLVLWIEDEKIVDVLRGYNLNVKEVNELERIMRGSNEDRKREVEQDKRLAKELANTTRYSLEFKAYPKVRTNRSTGKSEQYPKVMLRTTGNTVRLEAGSFGVVDSAHVDNIDIRFHPWQYDDRKPDCVTVLDEVWVTVDESAGEVDDSYFNDKYGYSETDAEEAYADAVAASEDDEDVPFK